MVLCIVPGCSKRSGRDKVSFYRIPKIVSGRGIKKEQLSKRRRAGYLAAIRREGVTDKILNNDRVCSKHFVTGKPAPLEDDMHPDWLPTQHLFGGKPSPADDLQSHASSATASVERYERLKRRQQKNHDESHCQSHDELAIEEQDKQTETECTAAVSVSTTGVQTELSRRHILLFQQELIEANERIKKLEELIKGTHQFTAEATLAMQ